MARSPLASAVSHLTLTDPQNGLEGEWTVRTSDFDLYGRVRGSVIAKRTSLVDRRLRCCAISVSVVLVLGAGVASGDEPADIIAGLIPRLADSNAEVVRTAADELEKLCIEASRPGAEKERRAVAMALIGQLGSDVVASVRVLVIEQLGLIGKYETAGPLGKVLAEDSDPRVREAARRALERLPVVTAKAKLRAGLATAEGELKMGLLHSLGLRRDALAVQQLLEAVKDSDEGVRLAAIEALALTGEINATPVVEEVLQNSEGIARLRVQKAYLRLASALVENSERGNARRIYDRASKLNRAAECAALIGFANAGLQSEVQRIVSLLDSDDVRLRGAAYEAAARMRGVRMARALIGKLDSAEGVARRDVLVALVRRADKPAVAKLLALAESSSTSERALVLRLVTGMEHGVPRLADGNSVLPLLFAALTEDPQLRAVAESALSQLHGQAVRAAVTAELGTARGEKRASLVRVFASRTDVDPVDTIISAVASDERVVRIAGLQGAARVADESFADAIIDCLSAAALSKEARDAEEHRLAEKALKLLPVESSGKVLAAARSAVAPAKNVFLRVLRRHRPPEALPFLKEMVESEDADTRAAALESLVSYPDDDVLPILVVFMNSNVKQERHLAAHGALAHAARLAGEEDRREQAAAVYSLIVSSTAVEDDLSQALTGLAEVGSGEHVAQIAQFLVVGPLQSVAASAVVPLAARLAQSDRERAVEVLTKVAQLEYEEPATRAVGVLERLDVRPNIAGNRGFVTDWWILAPLPVGNEAVEEPAPLIPAGVRTSDSVELEGKTFEWKQHHTSSVVGHLQFAKLGYGGGRAVAFCYVEWNSPVEQDAFLKIGTDDGGACWLNGELVHANDTPRRLKTDNDIVKVRLRAGTNMALLKIVNVGGDWGVCMRVTDLDDQPLIVTPEK